MQLASCKTQQIISNGAYSDISLTRESKDYTIKRLPEISTDGKAIFGIPRGKSAYKKQGFVFRFNGIDVNNSGRFLPIVSLIGLTLTSGFLLNELIGYKQEYVVENGITYSFYETSSNEYVLGLGTSGYIVPLIVGTILIFPISSAINNQIWNSSSFKRAAFDANSKLLEEYPDIDVFLNPKYDIERKNGIWKQEAILKVKVMGAIIKED